MSGAKGRSPQAHPRDGLSFVQLAFTWHGLASVARILGGRCPLKPTPLSPIEDVLVPPGAAPLNRGARTAVAGPEGSFLAAGATTRPQPRGASEERILFDALLERAGFDPAGFDLAVHPIRQSADLVGHMELMVTVSCRAARISRTYLARAQGAAWLAELSDDLRAGVYGAWGLPAGRRPT